MNESTIEHQVIHDSEGKPLFVLVPYDKYVESMRRPDDTVRLPDEVAKLAFAEKRGLVRAWREYRELTQEEVARRMGITQSAYAKLEGRQGSLRYATSVRLARALGIETEQLRV